MNSSQRARSWCFTLNNYDQSHIDTLTHSDFKSVTNKFCFQEEIGENENLHLQGVINFKSARHFDYVKKLLPKAHWEQCRNLKRSLIYCSKENTRNGEIYTHNYHSSKMKDTVETEAVNKHQLKLALDELKNDPIQLDLGTMW